MLWRTERKTSQCNQTELTKPNLNDIWVAYRFSIKWKDKVPAMARHSLSSLPSSPPPTPPPALPGNTETLQQNATQQCGYFSWQLNGKKEWQVQPLCFLLLLVSTSHEQPSSTNWTYLSWRQGTWCRWSDWNICRRGLLTTRTQRIVSDMARLDISLLSGQQVTLTQMNLMSTESTQYTVSARIQASASAPLLLQVSSLLLSSPR